MNENELKRKIKSGEFVNNNGRIIRTINILNGDWIDYDVMKTVLEDMAPENIPESMIYLQRAGYVAVRDKDSKADINIEDAKLRDVEVTLTHKGIKLARYIITDEAVNI